MGIALLVAVVDQVSKAAVRRGAVSLSVDGLLRVRMTENTGAAFSMFSGSGLMLTVLTALLIALVTGWLVARPESQPKAARIGLWMIVGGGLGNLYDRIVYGAVTDFIEVLFVRFAVFNLADAAICTGAFLAAVALYMDERRKETCHE